MFVDVYHITVRKFLKLITLL